MILGSYPLLSSGALALLHLFGCNAKTDVWGRFYEMFEMDAFVGVDCLGLQFMKGDQPHAGFPEAAYFTMAEKLARGGHRVVVVEQVSPFTARPCSMHTVVQQRHGI